MSPRIVLPVFWQLRSAGGPQLSSFEVVEDAQLDGRVVICEHFRPAPRASWGVLVRDDRHSAGASLLCARAQEIDDGPDGFCRRWLGEPPPVDDETEPGLIVPFREDTRVEPDGLVRRHILSHLYLDQ